MSDEEIDRLIADPKCWDGPGLGARFDRVVFARMVETVVLAAEHERHAKQLQRWADKCDDLADHADDHTRASLREMAAEMRPNAKLTGPQRPMENDR